MPLKVRPISYGFVEATPKDFDELCKLGFIHRIGDSRFVLIIFSEYILSKAKEKTDKGIVDFICDTISAGYDVILVKKVGGDDT